MDYNLSVGKGLMLIGPVGTMKTTMAVAVLRDLIEREPNQGYFIPMVSLLDQLNEERDSRSHILEDRIRHTRLLVLDDLGAEYDHAWVAAKIDSIVTERYNRMKSTIVTSNLRRDEIRDRYQMRIFDRLKSTNKLITFAGKSLRRTV
ncbi:ATP-binding protein [Megasphaera elsdenii]|jgi:DNA replication protein DnaC|uniref:ATP-binding protein n=2 Tax=Megasphaera elsdenii TaxID=907 RepID=A0A848EXA8_MEGEL|nr:ATP-binding protein [Megasphaera elsdenii]